MQIPLLKSLATGATPYLLAAFLAMAGATAFSIERAEKFKAQEQSAAQTVSSLEATLKDNQSVADACSAGTQSLKDAATAAQAKADAANHQLDTLKQQLTAKALKLHLQEANDRANPICKAILQTDISTACPGIADSLRQRATGGLQGSGGQSTSTDLGTP